MASHEGRFIWREQISTDVERSKAFYGELFNWTFKAMPMPGMDYVIIEADGNGIGGLMAPPPEAPPMSFWGTYLSVADVDAATAKAATLGGHVHVPPTDIPTVGRFSFVVDPQGAALYLFKPQGPDEAPPMGRPAPFTFCWETLNTSDPTAASAFYTQVAPWTSSSFNGMATLNAESGPVADVQAAPPGVPPHWLLFVAVPSLSDRRDAAARLGATVIMPEIDVPGVGKIAVIQDPVGAYLGLFEPGMD
jgi:predicted enzyme related to lactoylglutathione lyase